MVICITMPLVSFLGRVGSVLLEWMSMWKRRSFESFVLVGLLSGCASAPPSLKPQEFNAVLEVSGKSVDSLLQQGSQKEAIQLLDDMSRRNPDRKEPWARKAKIYFDAGNYAQAIFASEEVLQRDPAERSAKVIRAVAGLRIAGQSLYELRSDTELKGSARSDVVGLVKVMRETLGEDVLVPQTDVKREARPVRPKPPATPAVRRKAGGEGDVRSTTVGGNPFDTLK